MALSGSTLRDLKKEVTALRRRREAIDAQIASIKGILRGESAQEGIPVQAAGGDEVGSKTNGERKVRRRRKRGRRTFGRSIIAVMEGTAGLRPREVTEHLTSAGVTVRGKTSLPERVHRELRRLVNRGILQKSSGGAYELASSPGSGSRSQSPPPVAETS